jgi:hypothetical protein
MEALGRLCTIYRQPVFCWLRAAGLDRHDAEDATQDFFAHLLEKQRFARVTREGPRFRAYLLACLNNRMRDRSAARLTAKRGGGAEHLDLAQIVLAAPARSLDRELDRAFARTIHQRALDVLAADWKPSGRAMRFDALKAFVVRAPEPGEYGRIGRALGLEPRQVKRLVFDLREDYFDAFRAEVAQTVAPGELADELAYLVDLVAENP